MRKVRLSQKEVSWLLEFRMAFLINQSSYKSVDNIFYHFKYPSIPVNRKILKIQIIIFFGKKNEISFFFSIQA